MLCRIVLNNKLQARNIYLKLLDTLTEKRSSLCFLLKKRQRSFIVRHKLEIIWLFISVKLGLNEVRCICMLKYVVILKHVYGDEWSAMEKCILSKKVSQWVLKIFSSGQFSCSVVSDSLQPHEPQHTRPPCPPPTPGVYPNSCPLSWWCHPTISFSVVPFSSCPLSFPASGSFQKSHLFASGVQNIAASASTTVLPMNTQDWSPLGWTGWISLQSKGLSRVFSNTTVQKHQVGTQLSL